MKQPFMPIQQAPFILWHDNLKATATISVPGVAAGDITAMVTNNNALHTKMGIAVAADNAAKTAHADLNATIAISRKQASTMAKNVKNNAGFTPMIGDTLHIIGAEDSTDMTQEAPALTATAKANGVVEVGFNKLLADAVHLYSMRGSETVFTPLAAEYQSPYVDNRPLLQPGQPETRQYKGWFLLNKAETGLPSDVATAIAQP